MRYAVCQRAGDRVVAGEVQMNMLLESLVSGKSILRPQKPLEDFLDIDQMQPFRLTPGGHLADDLVDPPVGAETKSVEFKRCEKMASGSIRVCQIRVRQLYEGFGQPEV